MAHALLNKILVHISLLEDSTIRSTSFPSYRRTYIENFVHFTLTNAPVYSAAFFYSWAQFAGAQILLEHYPGMYIIFLLLTILIPSLFLLIPPAYMIGSLFPFCFFSILPLSFLQQAVDDVQW